MTDPARDLTVRQIDASEAASFLDLDQLVWAEHGRVPREALLRGVPLHGAFVAEREGELAGIAGSWDVELGIPVTRSSTAAPAAALQPAEGLTWVGVHPDHRRRGVLSALMRRHLRWTRETQGRSIAVLKASEAGIYGRFGYGVASSALCARWPAGSTFAAPTQVQALADATTTRLHTAHPDLAERIHDCWRRSAQGRAGEVVRSIDDVARVLTDVPEQRGEAEPMRVVIASRDGVDVGFAYLRRSLKEADAIIDGTADVMVSATVDLGARLALATRLTSLDLMGATSWWVPADDPMLLWHTAPRSIASAVVDSVWLRVVDLPAAVAQRGHATDLDLRVEVRDALFPEQAGRWRWTADGGRGALTREGAATEADGSAPERADVVLDVADLGAVWLGGQTLGARAAAGLVEERTPGAVAALDAALRTPTLPAQTADF